MANHSATIILINKAEIVISDLTTEGLAVFRLNVHEHMIHFRQYKIFQIIFLCAESTKRFKFNHFKLLYDLKSWSAC